METKANLWIKNYKYTAVDYLIFFMLATSSLLVFQVKGQELLMLVQTMFCLFMLVYYKKVFFIKNILINAVFLSVLLAMISALINNVRESYTKTAVYMMIVLVPVYFAAGYLNHYLQNHVEKWNIIRNALKLMCLIQMIWVALQFFLFKIYEIDLNQVLFVDKLHIIDNASFYKGGIEYMPTGFCWHPIIMAPVLVLAYFLFNSIVIKAFAILEGLFIGNSTVLIVVMLCFAIDCVYIVYCSVKSGRVSKFLIIGVFSVLVLALLVLSFTRVPELIWQKVSFVIQRIVGESDDLSTMAHVRYYTSYWKVLEFSSLNQIFFGYGEGCSGYTMSYLYNQYSSLKCWAVETDIMNIIYSRGIVGFLTFLGFLAQIVVKGWKVDYRYVAITICFLLAGITYNIQFSWVLFLELLMVLSLEHKVNLFEKKKGGRDYLW